ncbi:DUF6268 family outer membrane beta-barrel protein [Chryseobacterium taichungense]|uniref:DUF6268 family outer membrane beta-barrel protein n=1 Tax=Chryseobacterium taichungense TaxID=295069 RepID=UPI0028B1A500|nr:DUF6268 family outer membrane beta-barrel protein [Chryseobacterium taichungense]
MRVYKGLLLMLTVFFNDKIYAQEGKPDLFGVSYGYENIKNDSVQGKIKDIDAFLNFPIYRDEKRTAGGRLQFKSRSISGLDPTLSKNLYNADVFVFWQLKIKQKYKVYFFAQVGAYSDFKDISEEDFRYSFGARYTIQHNDNLKTGWGISYNRQFYGHQLNPFISVDYQITPKLQLTGLLPIRPKLIYAINDKLSWTNEISASAASYRLSASEENSRFLRINNWFGISSLEYKLAGHHKFSLGFGYDFVNNLKLYEDTASNNWSIFTFDFRQKSKPIQEIKTRGLRFNVGYSFGL